MKKLWLLLIPISIVLILYFRIFLSMLKPGPKESED